MKTVKIKLTARQVVGIAQVMELLGRRICVKEWERMADAVNHCHNARTSFDLTTVDGLRSLERRANS